MKETSAQKKARLIKLLHVAKGQLMMSDADYRTLLANVSRGKNSSTRLSVKELEQALHQMKAKGFVVMGGKKSNGGKKISQCMRRGIR